MKTIKITYNPTIKPLYKSSCSCNAPNALLCKQHKMKKHTVLQFNSGHLFGLPEIKRHTNTLIH